MRNRYSYRFIVLAILAAATIQAQDLTLDQIIKKNEDALGGAEAIGKVQTLKFAIRLLGADRQSKGVMTISIKRPNLIRTEVLYQGTSVVSAFDGTTAWMINPLIGVTEPKKIDEALASDRDTDLEASIGSLARYQASGLSIVLLGKEDVNGLPAYKLRITLKDGAIAIYYVHTETFLPIKTVSKVSETGLDVEIEGYPTDYRKIDGITFAHSIEQKAGSRSLGLMIYDKIEVNQPLDDNIFKMPIK
jgi:outer membrane lipoprotein-sorting protein